MAHDSDYCRRRSGEARAAAAHKTDSEDVRIAGDLALAYAALARRRALATDPAVEAPAIPLLD